MQPRSWGHANRGGEVLFGVAQESAVIDPAGFDSTPRPSLVKSNQPVSLSDLTSLG